jgi:glycosyltransferase involved in cell wall biosynthesis
MNISVIITNYNYANYVAEAIDSVITQLGTADELIFVDDGSSDGSVSLLQTLSAKSGFRLIEKENGGQASAFNAGFAAATGDLIWFLDADDFLLPNALERVRHGWSQGSVKLHAPMEVVDKDGNLQGFTNPRRFTRMASGDVRLSYLMLGAYSSPPTSGTVYRRSSLEDIFPVPEAIYRICADAYLKERSAFLGDIIKISQPLAAYRIHGDNNFAGAKQMSPAATKMAVERLVAKYEFLLSRDTSSVTTFIRSILFVRSRHMAFLIRCEPERSGRVFIELFPIWTSRWILRIMC